MKRPNTLSLTASKTEYPTSKTINFLGAIQRPDLVKAYTRLKEDQRQIIPLDLVKSGGTKQTRSASKMGNHIKDLADDFYSSIDYTQQVPMVFKNSKDYTIVIVYVMNNLLQKKFNECVLFPFFTINNIPS